MLGLSGWVSLLVPAAAVAAAWLLGRFAPARVVAVGTRTDAALEHRGVPWVIGALTTGIVLDVWGGFARIPVISDEIAYLLQAQLFANGVWKAPGPPFPEFFEQSHVLVTPVLASKYFPGHSLMMAPGTALGLPALSPLLLSGVAGGFMFLLARHVAGGRVALLTWLVWVSSFPAIYFRATYLSEMTSAAMWMIAWWCLLHWRRTRARAWMLGLAVAVGMVAITRPLTAVALAIPVGIVVVRDCARTRSWRQLGAGIAAGAAVLCVIPIWSLATLGSMWETPHAKYTRQYMPHDRVGFSYDTTLRAERPLPGSNNVNEKYIGWRRDHTLQALPRIAGERARMVARDMWYEWRAGLIPFAILGLLASPGAAWFGYATMLLQFSLYLLYGGPAGWTVYYMESVPMLAFAVAFGIAMAARKAAEAAARRATSPSQSQSGAALAIAALAVIALVPAVRTWRSIRTQIDADHAYFERFAELAGRIPDERAVVFVRYAPDHYVEFELVRNPPGHQDARLWIVFDRGAENARLIRHAPERRPWLFDEATWTLQRIESN